MKKGLLFIFLLLSGLLAYPAPAAAGTGSGESHDEAFNAGHLIIDHIVDSHEWHIATIGHTHITIPLPVILIDQGKLHVFSSSKFHHGHDAYKGFKIETERNANKGKIVKVIPGTMETDTSASKPIDLSITKNVVGIFVSFLVLLLIFFSVARAYKRNPGHAPRGIQSLLEPLILFIRDEVAKPSIGKHYEKFMPFLLTMFFFIFFTNLIGLIPVFPGGANVTGNIGVTLVLALFTFMMTSFSGNKSYWQHIFNAPGVPWWLKFPIPLFPIIEIIGVVVKPFVLMIRLFANITAGHIIVLGFISLIFVFSQISPLLGYGVSVVSVFFAIFISVLELLVAFIQAYVFTLLSALYFGMATEEHAHAEEHH
ncbi:FoF1-type ATP synthase, membrane subunit a [Lentimicrobium saccharophilum]|uniref:ATP synthase subunit a n=1 Tax=Lentimicrobium saccharophilum TaxID=1678841 RepID=A0A0S7BNY4_9BACT|nr:F0F1 ATP synthase subunit A [Lentimicrobium saccharophilum]GAP42060.1 FoF1-type ATP synthase, membrane subunit a [Lentimicrobium saccharophilum]